MVISYFPSAAGINLKFLSAASLPETGVENQILIITEETVSEYHLGTNQPDSPADNAMWVGIGYDGDASLEIDASKNFSCNLNSAKIYDSASTSWANCEGYIYQGGTWIQFARAGLPAKNTLENTSWADIAAVSDAGLAAEYWAVGDEKTVTINGVERAVRIIGFDHFVVDMATNEKKGIVFEFTRPLDDLYEFDSGGSAEWGNSSLWRALNEDFYYTLPSDLQSAIKECYPPYCKEDGSSIYYMGSEVFILSCEEYDRGTSYIYSVEANKTEPLAYYLAGNPGPWKYIPEDMGDGYGACLLTRSRYLNADWVAVVSLHAPNGGLGGIAADGSDAYVFPCFVV